MVYSYSYGILKRINVQENQFKQDGAASDSSLQWKDLYSNPTNRS